MLRNNFGHFSDVVAPYVTAFDDLVKGSVGQFLDLSNKIGGDVAKIVSNILMSCN